MPPVRLFTPQWEPVKFTLINGPELRSALNYVACCSQFNVENDLRYRAAAGITYCNIFVWDCTAALGCELPHWVDADDNPVKYEDRVPGFAHETSANDIHMWLNKTTSRRRGWWECSKVKAQERANAGFPTVASAFNPAGHGHIGMVMPAEPGAPMCVAQAGARNGMKTRLSDAFGSFSPRFYTHD